MYIKICSNLVSAINKLVNFKSLVKHVLSVLTKYDLYYFKTTKYNLIRFPVNREMSPSKCK